MREMLKLVVSIRLKFCFKEKKINVKLIRVKYFSLITFKKYVSLHTDFSIWAEHTLMYECISLYVCVCVFTHIF